VYAPQENDPLAPSNSGKANIFSDHLAQTFTSIRKRINLLSMTITQMNLYLLQYSLIPVTPLEIVEIIKNLHPKKNPGHDLITNKLINHLTKKSILFITYIYNSLFRLSYFLKTIEKTKSGREI